MTAVSANRLELLQISDAVAREKNIDKEIVLGAMEEAIQKAARSRYGMENEIKAHIDRKTGDIKLYRVLEVVENVENHSTEITVEDAAQYKDGAVIGDILADELPAIDFGRVAAQTAKQVIVQKVREAERAKVIDAFESRVGELVTGVVKKANRDSIIIDLGGNAEAIIHREVYRPWGKYDSVDNGERFQVKRITVNAGAKLSVQMHHHRAEHWIVVSGTAKVTIDETDQLLTENQSVYIPIGAVHALENPGKVPLELIEVRSGSYLEEDDIVRFDTQASAFGGDY